jgi:hypothetical protein
VEKTHHTEVAACDEADITLATAICDVPNLDHLVRAASGDAARDVWIDVDRRCRAVVRGERKARRVRV